MTSFKRLLFFLILKGGQTDSMVSSIIQRSSEVVVKRSSSSASQMTAASNVTVVKATLNREATIKCVAENLVGQKTVSNLCMHKTASTCVFRNIFHFSIRNKKYTKYSEQVPYSVSMYSVVDYFSSQHVILRGHLLQLHCQLNCGWSLSLCLPWMAMNY